MSDFLDDLLVSDPQQPYYWSHNVIKSPQKRIQQHKHGLEVQFR